MYRNDEFSLEATMKHGFTSSLSTAKAMHVNG